MLLVTAGGALATYFVSRHNLHSSRNDRVAAAQQRISDALRRRAYYLEDIGDMVGVHDDADFPEFSRWAHVRGRNEGAIVSVEWIRRSPDGTLVPPHDIGPHPMLVAPPTPETSAGGSRSQPAAASTVRLASSASALRFGPGEAGERRRGLPGRARRLPPRQRGGPRRSSPSAIVGLVDAQQLVAEAFPARGAPSALQLRDQVTPLATIGSGLDHAVQAAIAAPGRAWTLTVAGGSLTTIERLLPLLILLVGGALTLTVAIVLRNTTRRRDAALELASERSSELAKSLERVEHANRELEQAHAEAERLSREDPVTGIFNRRHFGEVLAGELSDDWRGTARAAARSRSLQARQR